MPRVAQPDFKHPRAGSPCREGAQFPEEIMSMIVRRSAIHTLIQAVLLLQGISMLFDASAAAQTVLPASSDAQQVIALEKRAWDLWKVGDRRQVILRWCIWGKLVQTVANGSGGPSWVFEHR
jgi:hypothetical protein